jgi:hypothetical protein
MSSVRIIRNLFSQMSLTKSPLTNLVRPVRGYGRGQEGKGHKQSKKPKLGIRNQFVSTKFLVERERLDCLMG